MDYKTTVIIGWVILLYAFFAGLYNYKNIDKASTTLLLLMLVTFINERIANYCIHKYQNSNVVYGLFNPFQLLLISLYYNYSIDKFRSNNVSLYIGLTAFTFGIVNYIWIQTPFKMNNFFLLLESLIVIALSLFSFYRMLLEDESLILTRYPHFWFTSIFLFFWTATFFIWGLYDYMTITLGIGKRLIHTLLLLINVIHYVGIGTVFLLYKKMQSKYG